MELKTVQIIDNVCKLDTDMQAKVLLKLNELAVWMSVNLDKDKFEEYKKKFEVKDEIYYNEIFKYLGLPIDDKKTCQHLYSYSISNVKNRIDILKKLLIERAVELESLDKKI